MDFLALVPAEKLADLLLKATADAALVWIAVKVGPIVQYLSALTGEIDDIWPTAKAQFESLELKAKDGTITLDDVLEAKTAVLGELGDVVEVFKPE